MIVTNQRLERVSELRGESGRVDYRVEVWRVLDAKPGERAYQVMSLRRTATTLKRKSILRAYLHGNYNDEASALAAADTLVAKEAGRRASKGAEVSHV